MSKKPSYTAARMLAKAQLRLATLERTCRALSLAATGELCLTFVLIADELLDARKQLALLSAKGHK